MLDALQNQLSTIAEQESVRVLIIGASGKAYSSGHDLVEVQTNTHELFEKCSQVMMSLNTLPQPVIAMVQGIATAAGCQLVASCDLAVASDKAKFGVSGINLGLFCSTPAVALSRNVGPKQAMQMLLTGDLISAHEALSYGLINKVVPQRDLHSETIKLATSISSKSSFAVRLGKKMFYKQLQCNNLKDAYSFATEQIVNNLQHHDTRRGIQEFLSRV
ncbi:hypothetical protein HJC23_007567 [Cyclotella cryptica]|uniref:Enoyl-CoA hydratase domain-containing protein 3, mitochondrial n=1 Tax=Cyclotella cryptica TaxID=29204 RepID=A0ABD3QRC7_9STRA